jgi:hypothetical protein
MSPQTSDYHPGRCIMRAVGSSLRRSRQNDRCTTQNASRTSRQRVRTRFQAVRSVESQPYASTPIK